MRGSNECLVLQKKLMDVQERPMRRPRTKVNDIQNITRILKVRATKMSGTSQEALYDDDIPLNRFSLYLRILEWDHRRPSVCE